MVQVNDIAAWREQIFASLLKVMLAVGGTSTVLMLPFLLGHGMWRVALADTIALAWTFAVWRLSSVPYHLRVLNFLAVVYGLSIVLLLSIGTVSQSYLLGPPLIAVILLSLRSAMVALALGAVSLVVLGASGLIALSVPGWDDPVKASLVAAINYSTVGLMLNLMCGTLLKGLSHSLADVRTFADTLERKQTDLNALNGELELTAAAVARLNDMVLIVKAGEIDGVKRPIIFVNDAFLRCTGYARADVIGHSLHMLQGANADHALATRLFDAMLAGDSCSAELMIYTCAGAPLWVEIEMVPYARAGEAASHWVVVGRDIGERRRAADAIHRLAFYDGLTNLPNRRLLMERLNTLMDHAAAGRRLGAVLYLDLDNFKSVNDARGHAVGDALLAHAARRLGRALRAGDTVARIGGDEFVILIDGLGPDPANASSVALEMAELVRSTLAAPLDLEGQTYRINASIGVALASRAGASAHDILREADTAMYHAKAAGRDGIVLFESAMLADAQRKLRMERDLAQALDKGELAMHLQLQVDYRGTPAGVELLMRWQRADGSTVRPDLFIPVAEASGMIVELGNWALRQACLAWLALERAGRPLPLSVNVSPLQFRQPDFIDTVRAILAETGVPAQQLIFEVTEGLLIEDITQTIARMHELAALGIRFSIDDFGTGYSNLAYLSKMPLYELKIDKSFVLGMPHDPNSNAIVQSILSMAGHLGLRVVAEGIESEPQARYLGENGAPYMQGYLYHRPMPLEQLIALLE